MTYIPDPGSLVELAAVVESTDGTYVDPTSGAGGVQLPTTGVPSFGLGHQIIRGSHLTGNVQKIITHNTVRGVDVPFIGFEVPFSQNTLATVLHMITGSALTSNAWTVVDGPPGFSIGIHTQRPGAGAGDYYKFAGCKVASAKISMAVGSMPTIALQIIARSLAFPDTSPTTFPTLTPLFTSRPFILTDSTLREASTGVFAGATDIKFRGFELDIDCGLLIEHNSSSTSPDSVTRTAFDTSGILVGRQSAEWWDQWKGLIAGESNGGFLDRYMRLLLNDGTNILRLTMPVNFELPAFGPDELAIGAPIAFFAGAVNDAPTSPVILIENV